MLTFGTTLWNSQIQRDPWFKHFVVNGPGVSVVLLVVLLAAAAILEGRPTAGATHA